MTMIPDDAAILTRGLTKRYGETLAVDSLDLRIERGEVFGLLGPNGAGKTTTILMLLGLTEPTGGSARILGLDPTRQAIEVKRKVGYLPDAVGFYANLTGRQNLRYTARLNRIAPADAEGRINALLEQVGLAQRADDLVATYSRGMLQRLGMADALVKDPKVLILDEPTIGIDPEGVAHMLELIRSVSAERGVTVLLSSHLLGQVQAVCDRIGIFVGGRLVACGTIDQLGAAHGGGLVIEVEAVGGDPEPVLRALPEVVGIHRDGDRLLLGAQRDLRVEVAQALAAAGLVPVHLRLRAEELGTIYHRYFTKEKADAASVG
jgi:ABC-2 type transport system ATP-binding protein